TYYMLLHAVRDRREFRFKLSSSVEPMFSFFKRKKPAPGESGGEGSAAPQEQVGDAPSEESSLPVPAEPVQIEPAPQQAVAPPQTQAPVAPPVPESPAIVPVVQARSVMPAQAPFVDPEPVNEMPAVPAEAAPVA